MVKYFIKYRKTHKRGEREIYSIQNNSQILLHLLGHMSTWLGVAVPVSPRLCLLGDQTEMPNISKHERGLLKVGMVTAARTILRVWKSTVAPDVKKWIEMMSEVASYERMLARINNEEELFKRAWVHIFL